MSVKICVSFVKVQWKKGCLRVNSGRFLQNGGVHGDDDCWRGVIVRSSVSLAVPFPEEKNGKKGIEKACLPGRMSRCCGLDTTYDV